MHNYSYKIYAYKEMGTARFYSDKALVNMSAKR